MGRRRWVLLALLLAALLPAAAFCQIYEYADADGNVTYYKYTDKRGSVVFSDRLAGIPDEYRKKNKIVRIGPPPRPAAPPAAAAPPAPQMPALTFDEAKPVAPAAEEEGGGGTIKIILGVVALLAVAGVVAVLVGRGRSSGGRGPARAERDRTAPSRPDARNLGRSHASRDAAGDGGQAQPRRESPQEALHRHVGAGDFAAAAQLCESLGRLGEAAGYHRQAGNLTRARDLYLQMKDYGPAAELFEKAGDDRKAAELYEAQSQREMEDSRGTSGGESARKSGELFEKVGDPERALAIYLKARHFAEAAALFERRGDMANAAESHLQAGNAEKAAECFEKAGQSGKGHAALSRFLYDQGRVREAAEHAELAGDPVQAATMYQEAGELAKAAELFFQGGFYDEAAENFAQVGDVARAAEAFEGAGKYLQAAAAFEKSGGDVGRIAGLYEKGGDHYAAGRLFVKIGDLDKALNVLQQVAADMEHYGQASLLVGMIFLKRGMTNLAMEKFTRIIGDRPIGKGNLEPYYFLALCHERAGDAQKARAIFEKILAEDYNFRDVKKRVAGG